MQRSNDVEYMIIHEARLFGELMEIRILLREAHSYVGDIGGRERDIELTGIPSAVDRLREADVVNPELQRIRWSDRSRDTIGRRQPHDADRHLLHRSEIRR